MVALNLHDEILKSLRASPVIAGALVFRLDAGALRRRPSDGEWSIIEVIAHMADTDETAFGRVRRMVEEEDPILVAFDPDSLALESHYIDLDVVQTLDRYEDGRTRHLTFLSGLSDAQWLRRGQHSEHGGISIELYESHVASEDVDHLAQISRLVLGIGFGPSIS